MNSDLQKTSSELKTFLNRYHYTLFLLLAAIGIGLGIYSLLTVTKTTSVSQDNDGSTRAVTKTESETIERIKNMQTELNNPADLPQGQRINPFAE